MLTLEYHFVCRSCDFTVTLETFWLTSLIYKLDNLVEQLAGGHTVCFVKEGRLRSHMGAETGNRWADGGRPHHTVESCDRSLFNV